MLLLGWAGLAVLAGLGWRLLANVHAERLAVITADAKARHARTLTVEHRLTTTVDRAAAQQRRKDDRADRALELRAERIAVHARVIALAEAQDARIVAREQGGKDAEAKRTEPMPPEALALITRESEPWAQDQVAAFLRERHRALGDWDAAITEARRLQTTPPEPTWVN